MGKYRVYMSAPIVWQVIEANSKEDAIEKAVDTDKWEQDIDYGGEDYEAFELDQKGHDIVEKDCPKCGTSGFDGSCGWCKAKLI